MQPASWSGAGPLIAGVSVSDLDAGRPGIPVEARAAPDELVFATPRVPASPAPIATADTPVSATMAAVGLAAAMPPAIGPTPLSEPPVVTRAPVQPTAVAVAAAGSVGALLADARPPFAAPPGGATSAIEPVHVARPPTASQAPGRPVATAIPSPDIIAPTPPPRAQPAFRAFAAALFEATQDGVEPSPVAATGVPLPAPVIAAPATAFGSPAAPPLDMAQPGWPHAMVARIERLRDDVDAGDTRIRLLPDALGAIEVSLSREGETVHVSFRADQAETRHLLAEARPELTQLAEARGIRLGDGGAVAGSSHGAGAGHDRGARPHPQPSASARPPRVATDEAAATDDTRIA